VSQLNKTTAISTSGVKYKLAPVRTADPVVALPAVDITAAAMRPEHLFKWLTSQTTPHGHESEYWNDFLVALGFSMDHHGNYWLSIPGTPESRVMFTAHLDTASAQVHDVHHADLNDATGRGVGTDGTSILGADDRAGITVLMWMIRNNTPGMYYLFVGEECGGIGSGDASSKYEWKDKGFDQVVSFDRRGTGSVITHQSTGRCCSDVYADALAVELNLHGPDSFRYAADLTGLFTDSANFTDLIPECTNISVGYMDEHTVHETQDLDHLNDLCEAVCKVDWANLPIKRDPNIKDYSDWGRNWNSHKWDEYTRSDYRYDDDESDYLPDDAAKTSDGAMGQFMGIVKTGSFQRMQKWVEKYPYEAALVLDQASQWLGEAGMSDLVDAVVEFEGLD
jgi:hypothetical protein